MPLFYFRTRQGACCHSSGRGFECADRHAAWAEMTKVCGDLIGSVSREMKQGDDWQMELLDETSKPLYRISLVGQALK